MIIKSRKHLPLVASDRETILPVLPLNSVVIFPGETHAILMGRKENLALLKIVAEQNSPLVVSFAPPHGGGEGDEVLSEVGVLARVQSAKSAPAGSRMVMLEGIRRIVIREIRESAPFLQALVAEVDDGSGGADQQAAGRVEIIERLSHLIRFDSRYSGEMLKALENISSMGDFADRVAAAVHFSPAEKQEILEAVTVSERLATLNRYLEEEVEKASLAVQINGKVTETLEKKRRESFLRQQLMEIRRELGEEFVEEDLSRLYQHQIRSSKGLPNEVAERLRFEADRLGHLSSSSTEYGSIKNYLEFVLALPWDKPTAGTYDLVAVEKAINADYYGSGPIKEQVLEYLAVRQLSRGGHDLPVLCLAGPVGTGKASLVRAIAGATGRQFVRLNGASLVTVADIKGAHRAEVGSGSGQLVQAIKQYGSFDLVMFLEDIEYVIESEDTNALLALMEAIDPRHNYHFSDNFLGIPLDFSRILIVLGISYVDNFPEPFSHHLEIVEMPGYIEREKIVITKRHILPKLYRRYGLSRTELKFSDRALTRIIRQYTMEAGLISLQQQLEKIFRKATRRKASSEECKIALTEANVDQFLGARQFIPEKATAQPEIGVATGVAWTGAGGDLMLIEGLKMRGTGQVIYTGSLGEIMKESIQAAHSFVRARADMLGIDHNDFVNFDIHIHFPQGAIPKDGPSAGVTVSLVIASVMAERPIRNDIAMTGEVTLRGKILSVGGIKEKVSAAYRAGIHTIILPKENEKDIKIIPREIMRKTTFIYVETVDELFEHALLEFTPSAYTLEKLFNEEIEKAKRRHKRRGTSGRSRRPAARSRARSTS